MKMKKSAMAMAVLVSLISFSYLWSGGAVDKVRYITFPNKIRLEADVSWHKADKKSYEGRRPKPDGLILNKNVNDSCIQFNLEKSRISPTAMIKLIKLMSEQDVRWYWVKYDDGEGPARVYFENDTKKKVGYLDVRHLPGRYSELLISGGSWRKGDHSKLADDYVQIVESVIAVNQ